MTDTPEQPEFRRKGATTRGAPSSSSVPEQGEETPHAEQRLPLDRSVRWVPRKLRLTGQEVPTPYDVFVSQSVLRDVGQHVAGARDEVVGLLGGRLFRCPDTGRPWVRIDAAMAASEPVSENAGAEALASALAPLRARLERSGARAVGWYHSHAFLGVFLSDRDTRFHRHHFPELWQCALVLVADRDRPAGGLFQPTAPGQIPQSMYLPLHEITGRDARTPDGRKRSVLAWGNYVPDEPVAREAGGVPPPTGSHPGGRAAAPPGFRAFGRAADRGEAGPPRTSPLPAEAPIEVPLVLPADEVSGTGVWLRRLGWLLTRVAALGVLALAGWLVWDRVIGAPGAERSPAVVAGENQSEAGAEEAGAVTAFHRSRDDFLRIVDAYHERRADFDLQRLGCDGLVAGYQRVDEAFLRMSEFYVALRDEPGPPPADRYEAAARRMEEVDRHFDASGCPRPQ